MPAVPRLSPGDAAPDFTLPDADGRPVTLSALRGGAVLLYAYPAAGTPGCTRQAVDFRDNLPAFTDAGYTVLGISPDPVEKLARFRSEEDLPFTLLADPDRTVLTAYGAYGDKQLYGKTVTGVIRSTFVVDPQGVIALAAYGVRATGHVAKLRRDLAV